MEGRDKGGDVAEEDEARRWMAASSERASERELEDGVEEKEDGESISSAASRSTSISSASMAVRWEGRSVGI
jgi:cytidylate kinase